MRQSSNIQDTGLLGIPLTAQFKSCGIGFAMVWGVIRSISQLKLIEAVEKLGGRVVNESAGRWAVLQLEAPPGMLWNEGVQSLRVEWPGGESSLYACADAFERIKQGFRPMREDERELYATD